MKAELTDISKVKKRLDIEIPPDVVSAEITTVAREFAKRARVPGFRPGRAPLGVVKNRYKDDILSEIYQHLLPRYFNDAVKERKLDVVEASTIFEPPEYANGSSLSFQVGFEIFPAFEVNDYSEIPVEEIATEVTEDELHEYLRNLVEERAQMAPVEEDRPLQTGDFAEITFTGSLANGREGAVDQELSREKALCEVGGETTVKEFTENLTGATVGNELSFEVVYRPDHPEKRLAGKTARYNVKVEGIKQKIRPELNDEFAQEIGEYQTLDALRAEVRQNMEKHRKENADRQVRDRLLRWLEDDNEFEVPDSLVQQQVQTRIQRLVRNLAQQGMNPRGLDVDWDKIRSDQYDQAVRDVRGILILERLAEKEGIAVTSEDTENELRTMAEETGQTVHAIREAMAQNDGLERMPGQIRNNKILDLLRDRVKFVPAGSLTPEPENPADDPGGPPEPEVWK